MKFDVDYIRKQFPALKRKINGYPAAYLDGPGGTQVPQRVIDKVVEYLVQHNANAQGAFATSMESDAILSNARETFADFFACSWEEVSFCQNSTTASFMLAQALSRELLPGDEIIITDMDHEANRGPWQILAEKGFKLSSVKMDTENCVIDMADYRAKLTDKTKVVAINYASNAVGTISDVKTMVQMAHDAGALTIVDAVHYALHGAIDVQGIDTDFLYCSAYKFFGPHVGILFAKKERMQSLKALKVGAQKDVPPYKFETGTPNVADLIGFESAIEYIQKIGHEAIFNHESLLMKYALEKFSDIKDLSIYGNMQHNAGVISFLLDDIHPYDAGTIIDKFGIAVRTGNHCAQPVMDYFDIPGTIRASFGMYNTTDEIDQLTTAILKVQEMFG